MKYINPINEDDFYNLAREFGIGDISKTMYDYLTDKYKDDETITVRGHNVDEVEGDHYYLVEIIEDIETRTEPSYFTKLYDDYTESMEVNVLLVRKGPNTMTLTIESTFFGPPGMHKPAERYTFNGVILNPEDFWEALEDLNKGVHWRKLK